PDWVALPLLAVASSFSVQSHGGYALLAVGLVAPALFVAVRSWRLGGPDRCSPRVLVVAVGLLALVWLPPVVEQLTGDPGNLQAIVEDSGGGLPAAGLGRSLEVLGLELGPRLPWATGSEGVVSATSGPLPEYGAGWALVTLVPFGVGTVVAARREDAAVLRLQLLLWGQLALAVVSAALIGGEIANYLVRWTWAIGALCWLSVLWVAANAVGPAALEWLEQRLGPLARVLVVAALAPLAIASTAGVVTTERFNGRASDAVVELAEPVADELADRGVEDVLVVSGGRNLPWVFWGVLGELDRTGVDARVEDQWSLQVGDHRVLERSPDATIVVAEGDEAVEAWRARTDVEEIAFYAGIEPAEQAELERLLDK
ncbi:MAG: hypothetical protein AAGK32_18860, partial [Actinomycetota bacterium]